MPSDLDILKQTYAENGLNPNEAELDYLRELKRKKSLANAAKEQSFANKAALANTTLRRDTSNEAGLDIVRDTQHWLAKFITCDQDMRKLKQQVSIVAPLQYPVLIYGETGTGKELIAKALHGSRQGNFVPVNCGGFPEHLIESELFGHVVGAFTGAGKDRTGLFQAAEGGTIFLDEIGELPLLMQCKLLRTIESQSIRKVGSNKEERINCRIVSATNKPLHEMVETKKFRQDLLWRINTITIETKPLRFRRGDVELITASLKSSYATPPEAQLFGNVRELQQLIIRDKLFNQK